MLSWDGSRAAGGVGVLAQTWQAGVTPFRTENRSGVYTKNGKNRSNFRFWGTHWLKKRLKDL